MPKTSSSRKIFEPVQSLKRDLILYSTVAALAFGRCLFFGQAYYNNDLLAQFGPWRAFLKAQLAQGHFPLWNPYLLGGQPFFADLQNMMFYPVNYPTLLFSVPTGLSVFFFFHMVLAALGMRLWLRSLSLSENAARAGALLFSLSHFFWLELIHPPVLAAFAWLPWFFFRLEVSALDPRPRNAFYAGFCLAMLFLCGSFQVTVGAFYAGTVYFLFRFFQNGRNFSLSTFKVFLPLALLFLWGALPLLGQFIPTFEFAKLTGRYPTDAKTELGSGLSLSPSTLGQFLFPRITLKDGEDMAFAVQSDKTATEFSMAADWGYLGIWLPFLVWGAWKRKDKSLPIFFSAMALLSLFYCFGRYTPFYSFLNGLLPGLSLIRVPFRFLYLEVLCASVLAAMGWDFFFSALPKGVTKDFIWKSSLVFAFGLYLVSLWRPSQNWREIFALGLGFAGFGFYGLSRLKRLGTVLVMASLSIPLLLNGWSDFEPGLSSNFDFEKKSQGVLRAAASVKPGRVIFLNQEMYYPIEAGGGKYLVHYPQNAACALGIKNFGGYNPLFLRAKDYVDSLGLWMGQLGAVGGILTQTDHGPLHGFKLESFPPYLFYRALKTPALVLPSTSIRSKLEKEEADTQDFSVEVGAEGMAAFTETMYPGWKAWVDGQPAPLSTYNQLLRGLYLTKGRHEVEFKFEPAWWAPIKIGLLFWILITLAGFQFMAPRKNGSKIA